MKIGIDARELESGMTGISRYLLGFIKYTSATPHQYFLYYSRKPEVDLSKFNIRVKILSSPKFLWDHITLPKALNRDRVDLFFSPYYKKPWLLKCKSIVTIHDLNPLFDSNYPFWYRCYFKELIKRSLSSADFILVVSSYVKEQLLQIFRANKAKIVVNYNAVYKEFCQLKGGARLNPVLSKYGIKSKYIFYVGNFMPHKNVISLIKAYFNLADNLKKEYKLVLGGKKSWLYDKLIELTSNLKLSENIIFTGFIKNGDLVYLYNGASVFVFPSLREGFGLPPLEAMACGTPVIASDTTSLPEVINGGGILVDPQRIDEITSAIKKVLTGKDLRENLIKKGMLRAKQFSPERMYRKILEVFRKCGE